MADNQLSQSVACAGRFQPGCECVPQAMESHFVDLAFTMTVRACDFGLPYCAVETKASSDSGPTEAPR